MRRRTSIGFVLLCSGCSFLTSVTPKGATDSCMTERVSPVVDAVAATGAVVAAVLFFRCSGSGDLALACGPEYLGGIGVSIAAIPYVVSAWRGFTDERCLPGWDRDAAAAPHK